MNKISVVGRDLDAWITATFLKLLLDRGGDNYEIEVIDIGSNLTPHDFYAVLPSYETLHDTLGANKGALHKTAHSHLYYGQRFSGWNKEGQEFFHAYDRHGINFDGVDFYQYWLKARQNGLPLPLDDFSLGVAAAKHSRFVSNHDKTGFSHATHGCHHSAIEYIGAVTRAAQNAGVKHTCGQIRSINWEHERIASIDLDNGARIESDFYIDASGPESILMNSRQEDNFSDWRQWFQCDRVITASGTTLKSRPAFSQITALSCGWCGLYPLANRTGVHVLYSSQESDFKKVADEVRSLVGVDISSRTERTSRCGIAKRPWIGNCLAVGSAAATLEPLDALGQHALVVSLVMLRQLFPNGGEYTNERKTYNEKMHSFAENLRNFQIAHYHLNTRDEPFWKNCRDTIIPKVLEDKISLFKYSGYVSIVEDETFQEENWTSIFNGHGLIPDHYSPLVDNIQEEDLINRFKSILTTINEKIKSSPTLE